MKVKLGPYISWVGPYQIADAIFFWHEPYPENELANRWDYRLHDQFGDWLASTWVKDLCEWIQSHRKRTEQVKIDPYDVWSMDHTLALIIHPMLLQLKEQKHGYGWIDDKDVPKNLRSTAKGARDGCDEYDWDHNAEKRYDYMLNELIWTFEQLVNDGGTDQFYDHAAVDNTADINTQVNQIKVDQAGLEAHEARIANGLRLFGKYFRSLWD